MLKPKNTKILSAAALVFALTSVATAGTFIEEIEEVFDTVPGHTLDISVNSGSVVIDSQPGDQVMVKVNMAVKAKNQEAADELLAGMEKVISQDGDTIRIKMKQKRTAGFFGLKSNKVKVVVTVFCPKVYNLDIETGSGNIKASNVTGDLEFDTGSGNVTGSMLAGEIDADTGSGNINLADIEGSVKGDTGSGNIVVKNLSGTLSGDTGSGSIKGYGSISQFDADTGSGGVHIVSDVAITGNSKADTGSGGVTVELPAESAFYLKADSGSGGVSCDFPIVMNQSSQVSKKRIEAQINEGGPKLVLDTGSGGISIRAVN